VIFLTLPKLTLLPSSCHSHDSLILFYLLTAMVYVAYAHVTLCRSKRAMGHRKTYGLMSDSSFSSGLESHHLPLHLPFPNRKRLSFTLSSVSVALSPSLCAPSLLGGYAYFIISPSAAMCQMVMVFTEDILVIFTTSASCI